MVITKDQMIPLLLEALPGFASYWESFLEDWNNPEDWPESGLPIYIVFCDLAPYLIDLLAKGESVTLKSAFDIIEAWQEFGDPYVKEAAVVGILEDIQNKKLHTVTSPEDFAPYLGTISRKSWNDLYTFWKDGPNEQ